ncbi:MAG: hypothetical protein K2H20_02640, partial [Bacilli bacterium]|nr:hypothetical protein [Bacilli bacterium]
YDIITDSSLASDDIFFFTPCLDEHINSKKEEYVEKKMQKLRKCFEGESVSEPLTITFSEDHFPEDLLPLPFVLKNIEENGGCEKFIIRTTEQLETLKRFYNEINDYDFECRSKKIADEWKHLGKEIVFDRKTGHSNTGISMCIFDYKDIFNERMVVQEYIETPTQYNTSMRVLTSSTGDILCASLKYMHPSSPEPLKKYHGYFDTYLSNPSSPYFLGNESIISNTVAGGNSILIGKSEYSEREKEILQAHSINTSDVTVPESVSKVAKKIAVACRREIGAISGMDFIYDTKTKTWKFLEQHEFPMLTTYAEAKNMTIPTDYIEEYDFHRDLDLNVRLHALSLFMAKKTLTEEQQKSLKLK